VADVIDHDVHIRVHEAADELARASDSSIRRTNEAGTPRAAALVMTSTRRRPDCQLRDCPHSSSGPYLAWADLLKPGPGSVSQLPYRHAEHPSDLRPCRLKVLTTKQIKIIADTRQNPVGVDG
jgi:hypothetical protein